MNRTTKIWLMAAAALVLLGVLGFVGVMAANHWEFSALGGEDFVTETYEIGEAFDGLSICSDTADIRFERSVDGSCRVEFYARPKAKHGAVVQRGTLLIEEGDERSWYEQFSLSFDSPRMTVYLPGNAYASLDIWVDTGDVVIPQDFMFETVQITASTGDVDYRASASGVVRIANSTGQIHAEGCSAGSMELSTSTGRMELRSIVCAGELSQRVSTGRSVLTDVRCQSLRSGGSTGELTMERVIAAETVSIERSTGDVKLEDCDAAELDIQTGTGDVSGTLLTEKVFLVQSDTGRVSVPETTAGGVCRVTTDTGDITITIP